MYVMWWALHFSSMKSKIQSEYLVRKFEYLVCKTRKFSTWIAVLLCISSGFYCVQFINNDLLTKFKESGRMKNWTQTNQHDELKWVLVDPIWQLVLLRHLEKLCLVPASLTNSIELHLASGSFWTFYTWIESFISRFRHYKF